MTVRWRRNTRCDKQLWWWSIEAGCQWQCWFDDSNNIYRRQSFWLLILCRLVTDRQTDERTYDDSIASRASVSFPHGMPHATKPLTNAPSDSWYYTPQDVILHTHWLTTRKRDVITAGAWVTWPATHSHGVFPGQLLPLVFVHQIVVHVVSVQQHVSVVGSGTHHSRLTRPPGPAAALWLRSDERATNSLATFVPRLTRRSDQTSNVNARPQLTAVDTAYSLSNELAHT